MKEDHLGNLDTDGDSMFLWHDTHYHHTEFHIPDDCRLNIITSDCDLIVTCVLCGYRFHCKCSKDASSTADDSLFD